jgi:8-oxo-dGTP pyrophosphatase MutT (NUDIX family)
MKERKEKSRIPILAAGGIVLRNSSSPRFAVVQSRKMETWGLPKGKLAPGEDAMTAACREVLEETGYRATIHEFLGTLAYEAGGRPKIVQFWRMEAVGEPAGVLMRDVKAVRWLAFERAVDQLTHLREKVFLEQVGPIALEFAESARRALSRDQSVDKIIVPGVPLAPAGDVFLSAQAEPPDFVSSLSPAADALAPAGLAGHASACEGTETVEKPLAVLSKKTLVRKTWGWFRHAAMLHRQMD